METVRFTMTKQLAQSEYMNDSFIIIHEKWFENKSWWHRLL